MLYAIIIVVIAVMVLIVKRKKGSNGEDGATRVPLKPAEPVQLKQNLSVYLYDNGKMRGGGRLRWRRAYKYLMITEFVYWMLQIDCAGCLVVALPVRHRGVLRFPD